MVVFLMEVALGRRIQGSEDRGFNTLEGPVPVPSGHNCCQGDLPFGKELLTRNLRRDPRSGTRILVFEEILWSRFPPNQH